VSPAEQWQRLGDGYRVDAEFILSSGEALTVPGGALFRSGQDWALFRIEDGRAHLRKVELGRRSGLEAEILSGVEDGDLIVVHPDDRVSEGARVEPL